MDVPDADTAVENPKDNFGLYKTASGSYIADTAGLAVGDQTNEPTLLVKQTVFRGQTSTSLYDFIYTPTGAVTYAEGDGSVYYKDSRDNWFRDNFSKDGVFQTTDSLTLSELRNEEAVHDLDLDGNGKVGDTIESELTEVFNSNFKVEYKLLDESNKFSINSETGIISLISPLDYNEKQSYSMVVEAHTSDGRFSNKILNLNINKEKLIPEEDSISNEIIENNVPNENR